MSSIPSSLQLSSSAHVTIKRIAFLVTAGKGLFCPSQSCAWKVPTEYQWQKCPRFSTPPSCYVLNSVACQVLQSLFPYLLNLGWLGNLLWLIGCRRNGTISGWSSDLTWPGMLLFNPLGTLPCYHENQAKLGCWMMRDLWSRSPHCPADNCLHLVISQPPARYDHRPMSAVNR